MGLQGGYTKYPCYLCLWDSRSDTLHYVQKEWPARTELTMGSHKVKWDPLIAAYRVLMPPLHINLGLLKQFVKGLKPCVNRSESGPKPPATCRSPASCAREPMIPIDSTAPDKWTSSTASKSRSRLAAVSAHPEPTKPPNEDILPREGEVRWRGRGDCGATLAVTGGGGGGRIALRFRFGLQKTWGHLGAMMMFRPIAVLRCRRTRGIRAGGGNTQARCNVHCRENASTKSAWGSELNW